MNNFKYVYFKNLMQTLVSKEEYQLLGILVQKLNWNIKDINCLADNIESVKDIIYLIVLGDWIKEECQSIFDIYRRYTRKFNYDDTNLQNANIKFEAIRSFIVAHPLNTNRHKNFGYSGKKKCIDICTKLPAGAKFLNRFDSENADFYITYYDDSISYKYKYEGHMYNEIWECVYYNLDRIKCLEVYLAKIRKKNIQEYSK